MGKDTKELKIEELEAVLDEKHEDRQNRRIKKLEDKVKELSDDRQSLTRKLIVVLAGLLATAVMAGTMWENIRGRMGGMEIKHLHRTNHTFGP